MRGVAVAMALAPLAGCTTDGGVADTDRAAAERWVEREQAPIGAKPVALWYANGSAGSALCGEIEAPATIRDRQATVRYLYDPTLKHPDGHVEMHAGWATVDPATALVVDANRKLFDDLWSRFCAPYAPVTRRLAALTGIDLDLMGVIRQPPRTLGAEELAEQRRYRVRRARELAEELR